MSSHRPNSGMTPDELVGDVFDGIGNREMARLGLELGQRRDQAEGQRAHPRGIRPAPEPSRQHVHADARQHVGCEVREVVGGYELHSLRLALWVR